MILKDHSSELSQAWFTVTEHLNLFIIAFSLSSCHENQKGPKAETENMPYLLEVFRLSREKE